MLKLFAPKKYIKDFRHVDIETLKNEAIKNGMVTLSEAGKKYVLDGIISIEELLTLLLTENN